MTTLTQTPTANRPTDQARRLRGLVQQHEHHRIASDNPNVSASVIAVTSGKGGVGKSSLALNLSIALARLDVQVALLDASLGLGHLDLMCGLNGYWNLGHVLAGTRRLTDITLDGPANIHVVPGAGQLCDAIHSDKSLGHDVVQQLGELETQHDVMVIDTGHAAHPAVQTLLAAADTVLVVTTPEPTALADAYATFKSMPKTTHSRLLTLVNRAESAKTAAEIHQRLTRTTRIFLESEPALAGWIPDDPEMAKAICNRTPLMVQTPDSPAGRAITQLATRLVYHSPQPHNSHSFFQRLLTTSNTTQAKHHTND